MNLPPNTQITQENVGLLKAGDVCRVNAKPTSWHMSEVGDIVTVLKGPDSRGDYMITPNSQWYSPDRLTYIGPDLGDGWIGWSGGENPVPGMRVDVRWAEDIAPDCNDVSENEPSSDWNGDWESGDITAFRPALSPPAEGEVEPFCTFCGDPCECGWRDAEMVTRTPTPAPADHIGDATEKVDWNVVGPKLVEALEMIVDICPATCETSAAHDMAEEARTALAAAQPEGK